MGPHEGSGPPGEVAVIVSSSADQTMLTPLTGVVQRHKRGRLGVDTDCCYLAASSAFIARLNICRLVCVRNLAFVLRELCLANP